jgi:hypothetical protein
MELIMKMSDLVAKKTKTSKKKRNLFLIFKERSLWKMQRNLQFLMQEKERYDFLGTIWEIVFMIKNILEN